MSEKRYQKPLAATQKKLQNSISVSAQMTELYSGPLPHPDMLKEYNEVLPGAAERILAMAESQISHRQQMEKEEVRVSSRDSLLGIIGGFVLTAGCMGSGVAIAFAVPTSAGAVVAALMGISGIGAVIITMINGTRRK